jgi:V/A-type H+-transporting ATPase subunit I
MQRVAIIAPRAALRETLVRVADAGCVEVERIEEADAGPATRRLRHLTAARGGSVALAAAPPDLESLEREHRTDLLAGEAEVEERMASAVRHGEVAALAGWCPAAEVPGLAQRLAGSGGALVPLRTPRGVDPPTLLPGKGTVHRALTPLVTTYGTVPYADLDPTWPAGITYVVMFGLMFGDVGHGSLLLLSALLLRARRPRRLSGLHRLWPFVAAAGVTSMLAGAAYGEFFGPTGLLPVLWLDPLEQPTRLLAASVALGGVLLGLAFAAGAVNRWREGGPAKALYATTGFAGFALFAGLGTAGGGIYLHQPVLTFAGSILAAAGMGLAGTGLFAATAGGFGGATQTGVQLLDTVVRILANTISFARLAAFGLTHAALGQIIWRGTAGLAGHGPLALIGAALVFVLGNVLAFALEALVAGVQALRLEFYELFSRVFETLGRPFLPWQVPVRRPEVKR